MYKNVNKVDLNNMFIRITSRLLRTQFVSLVCIALLSLSFEKSYSEGLFSSIVLDVMKPSEATATVKNHVAFLKVFHKHREFTLARSFLSTQRQLKYCDDSLILTRIKGEECDAGKYKCVYIVECSREASWMPPIFIEASEMVYVRHDILIFYVGAGNMLHLDLGADAIRISHQN